MSTAPWAMPDAWLVTWLLTSLAVGVSSLSTRAVSGWVIAAAWLAI